MQIGEFVHVVLSNVNIWNNDRVKSILIWDISTFYISH